MIKVEEGYSQKALEEIPRLLSILDRNPFSPTFGCFSREYWLTRVRDFPDAIAQFGTLSLALVWAHNFSGGETYYHNNEIKNWVIAGIRYWIKIQHRDGSYDEFYPNERGWAGPTGFLLYAMIRSYELLGSEFPADLEPEFFRAVQRSAWFLVTRDEDGILANHHAMALLPIWAARYHLRTRDRIWTERLEKNFNQRLQQFLSFCYSEGWSLEYDGADPGYLSATISFLSKLQRYLTGEEPWAEKIQTIIDKAIDFSSYFLYPNGSYAGTIGSRQTLHFYPHGYELQAARNPLAVACARFAEMSLKQGRLVPPGIQDDRYFLYRIPEFLEAACDHSPKLENEATLPHQQPPFVKYFPQAKIAIENTASHYLVINLAKGGVLKLFDKRSQKLVLADDGLMVQTENKKNLTSQWIGPEYSISVANSSYQVEGQLHRLPTKYFNPLTMMGFRLFMLCFGWNASAADFIKGLIRRLLMTRSARSRLNFSRQIQIKSESLEITTRLDTAGLRKIRVGGQFAARYVPQSRYFQPEELSNDFFELTKQALPTPVATIKTVCRLNSNETKHQLVLQ